MLVGEADNLTDAETSIKRAAEYAKRKNDPLFKEKKKRWSKTYYDSVKDTPRYKAVRAAYYANRKAKDPQLHWATRAIYHHKRLGHVIEITAVELAEMARNTSVCPFCGTALDWSFRNKLGPNEYSPSVDRINNETVLRIDNVQVLCIKCNVTKGNRTMSEFLAFCRRVLQHEESK